MIVYKAIDGKAVRTVVKTGVRQLGNIEIVEGLKEGDIIIQAGLQRINRDGQPIKVVEARAGAGAVGGPGGPGGKPGEGKPADAKGGPAVGGKPPTGGKPPAGKPGGGKPEGGGNPCPPDAGSEGRGGNSAQGGGAPRGARKP
jgi:membrane fusion protein (multidrug efflux system)